MMLTAINRKGSDQAIEYAVFAHRCRTPAFGREDVLALSYMYRIVDTTRPDCEKQRRAPL